METQARVGSRVPIPMSFPASQHFLEMRILGNFPHNTVFAVLYAFIESLFSFRSTTAKTRLLSLLASDMTNVPYIGQLLTALDQDFQSNCPSRLLQQPEDLYLISDRLASKLRLESRTEYEALKTCETLFEQLGVKGNCYFIQGEINASELEEGYQGTRGDNGDFQINLCAGKGKIFGLFTTLTADSFLHLNCGHLMLKFDLLGTIATHASNYSFDAASLIRLQIKCLNCRRPLLADDFNQLFSPKQPSYQVRGNCEVCWGNCEQQDGCAKCGLLVCANCEVVATCTTGKPICLGCQGDCLEVMSRKPIVKSYLSWLQRVLDIATQEHCRQKQIEAANAGPEPIPITNQTAAPVPSGPRPGSVCTSCKQKVRGSPVMCPNQCYCAACEWTIYYGYIKPPTACHTCKSTLGIERMGKKTCLGCRGDFAYRDLFYFCVACGVASCPACAKVKLNKEVKKCASTGKKHNLPDIKRESIGMTEECAIW